MSPTTAKRVMDALLLAYGNLRGRLYGRPLTQETIDVLTEIEATIGATLEATHEHDAGAWARCSFCGRYTADIRAIHGRYRCDCGSTNGWSGSFVRPGANAKWSLSLDTPTPEKASQR